MKSKLSLSNYASLTGAATVIILLDQWTKSLVRANLAHGEIYQLQSWISQYVRIVHWHNYGMLMGLFENLGWVFTLLPVIISAGILFYFPRVPKQNRLLRLAMILYLGGAIGNLIDRLSQGYVTDFVSIGSLPVFNLADVCIAAGAVALILGITTYKQEEKGETASPPFEEPTSQANPSISDPNGGQRE